MPIESGSPRQITNDWAVAPVVSPDGKLIAALYKTADTAPGQLAFFPYEGGKPLRVVDPRPTFTGPFRWAPDGRAREVVDKRDDVSNIWSVDRDTGALSQITHFTSD